MAIEQHDSVQLDFSPIHSLSLGLLPRARSMAWHPSPRPGPDPCRLFADGVHSVTAQCALRVTIITDEMLTHSITLRLEDMSPERFLSPLLGLFIQAVAATLATPPDHVVVFNVQRDTDAPGGHILNVSLSVGQPPGPGGGPPFLPSEDLQERLYLNRSLLTAISAQRVLPFDDNICLREPCENYMRCVSVLRFDSSAPFIASSSVLFLSLIHISEPTRPPVASRMPSSA